MIFLNIKKAKKKKSKIRGLHKNLMDICNHSLKTHTHKKLKERKKKLKLKKIHKNIQ